MGGSKGRQIKVMHVIARMNVGGPAVEITELMRGFDPNQISQRLVTGYVNEDEADFLETHALDIEATRIDGLGRSIRPTDDIKVLATLTRMIRASHPDIVHTHTAKAGALGRIAAKAAGTGARIVHTHHGHLLHGYFGRAKTRVVIELERQLSKITDRIITVGDKVRDDLLEVGIGRPEQYTVIRSGVRLGSIPDKATARRELGLPHDKVIVSMIGRLTKIKRPDRFADVAEMARDWNLNVHFIVAGGGEEERALRDRVERSGLPVTMLGWRSDVERVLAASDAVLLTSDSEGTPLSLVQAGLGGLAVVATNVGAVGEVVLSDRSGILVEPEVTPLVVAIQTLAVSLAMREKMGAQGRLHAAATFGPARFLRAHQELYRGVVHESP